MFENTLNQSLDFAFKQAMAKSDSNRQSLHQDMAAFYYNDYEEICRVLASETLDNPYSQETIDRMNGRFAHIDHIRKIVKKITAGIYTQRPTRRLMNGETEDESFAELLEEMNFHDAVIEAFEAAAFFNIAFVNPVYNVVTNKFRLDVITPESVKVITEPDDYLAIKDIAIRKCYGEEIRYTVWTKDQHFVKDENGNTYQVGDNDEMINPFGMIPVSVLRLRRGQDFYGEPNWNLYNFQKDFDIIKTDKKLAEQKIIHQAWLAVNMGLSKDEVISAGKLFNVEHKNADLPPPSLESVTSNYDFQSLRENAEWDYKNAVISQGISASNVSTDVDDLSGIAKMVDNQELEETRIEKMNKLYDFEIDLMNKIRTMANVYGYNFREDAEIEMEFVPNPVSETVSDKTMRREMEKKYFISNEIDFVLQDLELNSREEAIEHIKTRQEEIKQLNIKEDAEEINLQNTEPGMEYNGTESDEEEAEE